MNIISKYPDEDKTVKRGWKYYVPLSVIMTLLFICMLALAFVICQLPDIFAEEIEVKGEPIQHVQEFIVPQTEAEEEEPEPVIHLTDDDILAQVAMSEAGNQDILGMAFVVMTVLNRCDYYGATVETIVNAPHQYAYPYYGSVSHNAYTAVELAREYRHIFKPIAWFRTGKYSEYGEPAFKWGDHYFSYISDMEGN